MNEFPVIRDLLYVQRILGLPGGKHCNSNELHGIQLDFSSKRMISDKERCIFVIILQGVEVNMIGVWNL